MEVSAATLPAALVLRLLPPRTDLRQISFAEGLKGNTKRLRRMARRGAFPTVRQVSPRTWDVDTGDYIAWAIEQRQGGAA